MRSTVTCGLGKLSLQEICTGLRLRIKFGSARTPEGGGVVGDIPYTDDVKQRIGPPSCPFVHDLRGRRGEGSTAPLSHRLSTCQRTTTLHRRSL